jgi:hypothetical protein
VFSKTISHNTTFPFLLLIPKKVLYEKLKQKKSPVVYKTDKITNLHGHEVIRTPVRHCELNPIELKWAQVKGFVAKSNTTFRFKSQPLIKPSLRVPACKTIKRLPLPEDIFGPSDPSF